MTAAVLAPERHVTQVTETVEVTPVSEAQARRAAKPAADWTVQDLLEYVTEETDRTGHHLPCRDALKIMTAFQERYGTVQAVRVARAAFETHGGMWAGAPVTFRRFAESNDEFFSRPIAASFSP